MGEKELNRYRYQRIKRKSRRFISGFFRRTFWECCSALSILCLRVSCSHMYEHAQHNSLHFL